MRPVTSGETRGGAWYIVGVFGALLAIAYFDRFILALLVDPISQELGLSDGQMGLLLGFGFAVLYSFAGLPIAWYLDRGNRVRGVVLGVVVWSASTVASAFADSFAELLLFRAGVAIGEAVLTPALVSLVADLFEPRDRGRPTAIYLAIGTIMTGGAFVGGGFAVEVARQIQGVVTDLSVWRITLILVGLPGFLFALLLYATVDEPERRRVKESRDGRIPRDAVPIVAHMRAHLSFYLPFYLAYGLGVSVGFSAFSWVPTILARSHGFELADSGYTFGIVAIPAIVAGTLFWSWLAGRLGFRSSGPVVTLMIGVAVAIAAGMTALLWNDSAATIVGAALLCGGSACFTPVCALIVQEATPPEIHARLMAVALLSASIIGAGVGPLAPPLLADLWGNGDPTFLRQATFGYALVAGIALFALLFVVARGYLQLVRHSPEEA